MSRTRSSIIWRVGLARQQAPSFLLRGRCSHMPLHAKIAKIANIGRHSLPTSPMAEFAPDNVGNVGNLGNVGNEQRQVKGPRVDRRAFLKEITAAAAAVPRSAPKRSRRSAPAAGFASTRAEPRRRGEIAGQDQVRGHRPEPWPHHRPDQRGSASRWRIRLRLCQGAGPPRTVHEAVSQAKLARSESEVLEDKSIQLVLSAGFPTNAGHSASG